jgi:hypothetical protein
MTCRAHEVFYTSCGHVFRCEEPANVVDPASSRKPHTSIPAHPCNKHLPRTISSADRSPVGSWRICPECEGGPKLPDHFKLQKYSCKDAYLDWDWEEQLQVLRNYYENEMFIQAQVEWCLEDRYGQNWELGDDGMYKWEKEECRRQSCHARSAEQQLRENRFNDS